MTLSGTKEIPVVQLNKSRRPAQCTEQPPRNKPRENRPSDRRKLTAQCHHTSSTLRFLTNPTLYSLMGRAAKTARKDQKVKTISTFKQVRSEANPIDFIPFRHTSYFAFLNKSHIGKNLTSPRTAYIILPSLRSSYLVTKHNSKPPHGSH